MDTGVITRVLAKFLKDDCMITVDEEEELVQAIYKHGTESTKELSSAYIRPEVVEAFKASLIYSGCVPFPSTSMGFSPTDFWIQLDQCVDEILETLRKRGLIVPYKLKELDLNKPFEVKLDRWCGKKTLKIDSRVITHDGIKEALGELVMKEENNSSKTDIDLNTFQPKNFSRLLFEIRQGDGYFKYHLVSAKIPSEFNETYIKMIYDWAMNLP